MVRRRRQHFKCTFLFLAQTILGASLGLSVLASGQAHAVVKFFDGFGDADLDNNGTPLELLDVDVDFNDEISTYAPDRDSNADESTNLEVTTVEDASDVGLRWLFARGYTNSNQGDAKPLARILDDSQGAMLETKPASESGLGISAIDDGYALSLNAKGRGSSIVAFFDETVALGPEVGDQVKASFDFRVWRDAPNANPVVQPADAELRFGLYQDTDDQLGMTNPFAGRDVDLDGDGFVEQTPAVWGEEGGWFEGARAGQFGPGDDVGPPGDHGWFAAVILDDKNPGAFPDPLLPNGGDWRIREETNTDEGGPNDQRFMQGTNDTDTVALPQESTPGAGDFGLFNLDVTKVYNLSLTLERFTDRSPGDTILASLTATDGETGESWTLSDFEPVQDSEGEPDGIFSDSWDYFAVRNTGFDDFDMVIDNFMLEIIGSNATEGVPGDYNDNGIADAADYTVWRDNLGTENALSNDPIGGTVGQAQYEQWKNNFGNTAGAGNFVETGAVPEPGTFILNLIAVLGLLIFRRRLA